VTGLRTRAPGQPGGAAAGQGWDPGLAVGRGRWRAGPVARGRR